MRNDFAVFILTHGRADNVATMGALKKGGYPYRFFLYEKGGIKENGNRRSDTH